jgi:hypothetical protein
LNLVNRRALQRLLWSPNELGFARAQVYGDIDIEGDLLAGLDVLEQMSDPSRGPGVRTDSEMKKALAKAALRLGDCRAATEATRRGGEISADAGTRSAATPPRSATITMSETTSSDSCWVNR